jgi:hypothetical protein
MDRLQSLSSTQRVAARPREKDRRRIVTDTDPCRTPELYVLRELPQLMEFSLYGALFELNHSFLVESDFEISEKSRIG